jgi:hypothetical protein
MQRREAEQGGVARRHRNPGVMQALACAVLVGALAVSATAADAEEKLPTRTAEDVLDAWNDAEDLIPLGPPPLFGIDVLAPEPGEPPALNDPRSAFWRLREALSAPHRPRGNGRELLFLQGRWFDVLYAVRYDKKQEFDFLAKWGVLALGTGKRNIKGKNKYSGFGGLLLPFDDGDGSLRLGAESDGGSPRFILGLDLELGGPD